LIKLSNIARTDFLGSVTYGTHKIIGKQNDFSNSTDKFRRVGVGGVN